MSETQPSDAKRHEPEIYEIRIQGYLHYRRVELFEGLTITRESDGTTTLLGPLPDQTDLHSILLRIRNMNLKLISVNEIGADSTGDPCTNSERIDEGLDRPANRTNKKTLRNDTYP